MKEVASSRLNQHGVLVVSVPEGHNYLVCIYPPRHWRARGDGSLLDWDCLAAVVGTTGVTAPFKLEQE
jgi:hypothetical protein